MASARGSSREAQDDNDPDNAMPQNIQTLYKLFGRETQAGRAIFNIYSKGKTNYSPNVNVKTKQSDPHAQHLAKKKAEAKMKERKNYIAPAKKQPPPRRASLPAGRKRSENVIKYQMDQEKHEYQYKPIPNLLIESSEDKIRKLQEKMSGVNLDETRNGTKASTKVSRQRSSSLSSPTNGQLNDPDQLLYDKITAEISERVEFLDKMKQMGQDKQYDQAIKAEISERLAELKLVEQHIKDKQLKKSCATNASSSSSSFSSSSSSLSSLSKK